MQEHGERILHIICIGGRHMNNDSPLKKQEELQVNPSGISVKKSKLDLVVLGYMAQRIYLTLHQLDQPADASIPLLYYSDDRHRRIHRIAIYKPRELLLKSSLTFVGFVSGRQRPASSQVSDELHAVDKKLIAEFVDAPGILSYSSLELRDGNWCNLVLFTDADMKIHVKNADTHKYAAYELAPRCYEWIRLHNGTMSGGLAHGEMILQKTRYYWFPGAHQRPIIREISHEA